jgi:hypothetical protein
MLFWLVLDVPLQVTMTVHSKGLVQYLDCLGGYSGDRKIRHRLDNMRTNEVVVCTKNM